MTEAVFRLVKERLGKKSFTQRALRKNNRATNLDVKNFALVC